MTKEGMAPRHSPFPLPGTQCTQQPNGSDPGQHGVPLRAGLPRGDPPARGPRGEEPEKAALPQPPGCTDLQVTPRKFLRPLVFQYVTQKGQARLAKTQLYDS